MSEEDKIMNEALEKVKKMGKIWRCNFSIGFRNGDVQGSSWEEERLLEGYDRDKINELKNFGTKDSLAKQVIDLERELKRLRKG